MADEMFIPLQREKEKSTKEMVKMAIIFEDIKPIKKKNGTDSKRNQIVNKTIVASTETDFWDSVNTVLHQKYDMEKVKNIFIMGDGANWIKAGVDLLKYPTNNVKFIIDSFHFNQAIMRLGSNKEICEILRNYAYHNMKNDFIKVAKIIVNDNPDRKEPLQQNLKYIINHWKYYQLTINKRVKGCPMEQAVSHILASEFTSVAKAYGRNSLPIYLNNRIIHQNNYDLRSIVLNKKNKEVVDKYEFDFSIFQQKNFINPTIQQFNKNIITNF
jgi:hypothetical protein